MTYKETLFFIGKCLTINHENHNKTLIEQNLKNNTVDWDAVVKVSTGHFVFPALYLNLKRANFLHYLPTDLVEYMQHITDLNRERNEQIISQAKEINELLLANNIIPIFLKGTGNLLEGLYDDIAERMVGDIDFLVAIDHLKKSVNILKNNGYSKFHKNKPDTTFIERHYPKMTKENRISSVEIHYRMVSKDNFNNFNYSFIEKNIIDINTIHTLSHDDKIIMTTINKQVNDHGEFHKSFGLRNSYDLFLQSKLTNTIIAIQKTQNHQILNNFLYSSFKVLGHPKSILFIDNKKSKFFFKKQLKKLKPSFTSKITNKINWPLCSLKILFILKATYNKKYRDYIFLKLTSKPNS